MPHKNIDKIEEMKILFATRNQHRRFAFQLWRYVF